jgi:hypothetical protein
MGGSDVAQDRRIGLLLLLALAIMAGIVWFAISDRDRHDDAVRAACDNAHALLAAGLLEEAQTAYRAIARADRDPVCTSEEPLPRWRRAYALAERAQGDQYLRAAQLTRAKTPDSGRKQQFDNALVVAIDRARAGYIRSLDWDPFDRTTHASLRKALALMTVPADELADERCATAQKLRQHQLLPEAEMLYSQALRTASTRRCVASGLRDARAERATALSVWLEGRAAEDEDREQEARSHYLSALTVDPSLTIARTALAETEGPDPRGGTPSGRLSDVRAAMDDAADVGGDISGWFGDHTSDLAVGGIVLALAVLLAMVALFLFTATRFGHRFVAGIYEPRFTRLSTRINPFTPDDPGHTSATVFAQWLSEPPPDPNATADESLMRTSAPLDIWQPPEAPADDLVSLLAGLQPGALGAVATWVKGVAPRREVQFSGRTLARCEHGPGLRVVLASRRGRPRDAGLWWATDLPGKPLVKESEEAEARHALAIHAAAWAYAAARNGTPAQP